MSETETPGQPTSIETPTPTPEIPVSEGEKVIEAQPGVVVNAENVIINPDTNLSALEDEALNRKERRERIMKAFRTTREVAVTAALVAIAGIMVTSNLRHRPVTAPTKTGSRS